MAGAFLPVRNYRHLQRWAKQIDQHPMVQRGRMVNRTRGESAEQLHERHDTSDFVYRTRENLDPGAASD